MKEGTSGLCDKAQREIKPTNEMTGWKGEEFVRRFKDKTNLDTLLYLIVILQKLIPPTSEVLFLNSNN